MKDDLMGPFDDDIFEGKGFGYKDSDTGKVCMVRCFQCGLENYLMAVTSGTCAWCGHDANAGTGKK